MEKNIHKNGHKLSNDHTFSPRYTPYKILHLERTNWPLHLDHLLPPENGLSKRRLQSRRKVFPSFYAFLTIFVVTLLVILVNRIPTGPRLYPDIQYQARLKANYYKPPAANLSHFVLTTELLIKPTHLIEELLNETRLIVIVISSVDHFDQRQAIRDTWARVIKHRKQKLFFLIGKPFPPAEPSSPCNSTSPHPANTTGTSGDSNDADHNANIDKPKSLLPPIFTSKQKTVTQLSRLEEQIVQEDLSFKDLIQYDFYDSYYNLTLKSLLMLRFFNQEILNLTSELHPFDPNSTPARLSPLTSYPTNPKLNRPYIGRLEPPLPLIPANWTDLKMKRSIFLLKVDDDMFVQANNLLQLIDKLMGAFNGHKSPLNPRQEGYKILLGGLIKKAQPIRDPRSKYFVPFSVYPYNVYPNYLSGTGYLMTADVARSLFITATLTPSQCKYFFLEDLFITGFCAAKAVKMYDDYRYSEDHLMDIQLIHNFGFRFREIGSNFDVCNYLSPYIITIHGLTPAQIRYLGTRINQPAKTATYCTNRKKTPKNESKSNRIISS